MPNRVVIFQDQVDAIATDPGTQRLMLAAGEEIARAGAALAVHRTGAGARSFHAELGPVGGAALVAWDRLHYYMFFHEVGAGHTPLHPALGPAVNYVSV